VRLAALRFIKSKGCPAVSGVARQEEGESAQFAERDTSLREGCRGGMSCRVGGTGGVGLTPVAAACLQLTPTGDTTEPRLKGDRMFMHLYVVVLPLKAEELHVVRQFWG